MDLTDDMAQALMAAGRGTDIRDISLPTRTRMHVEMGDSTSDSDGDHKPTRDRKQTPDSDIPPHVPVGMTAGYHVSPHSLLSIMTARKT